MSQKVFFKCQMCGRITEGQHKFHRECVIDNIYKAVFSGEKLTPAQRSRCRDYKVSLAEIKQDVAEDRKGKIKDMEV